MRRIYDYVSFKLGMKHRLQVLFGSIDPRWYLAETKPMAISPKP